MGHETDNVYFGKAFRGYNPIEVDEYIDSLKDEIETLKKELRDTLSVFKQTRDELIEYKEAARIRKETLESAKAEADEIIREAKNRAAHITVKANNQCNEIVSNMVTEVEKQKRLYESTKEEVISFRDSLMEQYRDHIKRINALFGTAGGGAVTGAELEEYLGGLESDVDFSEDMNIDTVWDEDALDLSEDADEFASEEEAADSEEFLTGEETAVKVADDSFTEEPGFVMNGVNRAVEEDEDYGEFEHQEEDFSSKTEDAPADPDDDSDEFYIGSQQPIAGEVERVLQIPSKKESPQKGKRWKAKKSKSLTDEFDAVKLDEE